MVIYSILPDIRLFSVYGIRPDIQQVKSGTGIRPDIKKGRIIRPDSRPAGYQTGRISGSSLVQTSYWDAV
jgi:hypothetical protein